MKKQTPIMKITKSKLISIYILFVSTLIIIFLGIFFSFFSVINNIHFQVLNSSISGAVLGLLVLYLGIKYYLSVTKLKSELFKTSTKFSWSHFKKDKFNNNFR
jgi:hypothetical protein